MGAEALEAFAAKLGMVAQELGDHAVRYQRIHAATTLAFCTVLICVTLYSTRRVWKKLVVGGNWYSEDVFACKALLALVAGLVVTISLGIALEQVSRLIEPVGFIMVGK